MAGEGARAAAAAITSPFSTWPRLPLPATEARSILSSAAILAAAGAGGIAIEATGAGAALARGSWGGRPARSRRYARELAEQRADRDRLTGLGGDLTQDPRARRVDLERHLVGLQLHQRLVGLHRIAGLLEPFADGCFADRLPQRWDTDLSRHFNRAARRPSLSLGSYGSNRRKRLAGAHRDPQHAAVFIGKAARSGDDRVGFLHRFERRLGGCFDDGYAIAAVRIRDWAHSHHHARLNPRRPIFTMRAHKLRF